LKETIMRRVSTTMLVGSGMAIVAAVAGPVRATPASGFVGTTVAAGRFADINVFNHLVPPDFWKAGHGRDVWLSWQRTKGDSDVYVQSNVWQPGGTTGWHTHPGHSLIIVTAGTVTAYEGDDAGCTPHTYTVGMGFVDPGGGHVHAVRNDGDVEARTITVQVIPAGALRRVDAPDPGHCGF
jgi:quercetin dioxygenase-like cupin family protein